MTRDTRHVDTGGLDATAPPRVSGNASRSGEVSGVGKCGQGAIVPSDAAQRDDAEGFDLGMVINGTMTVERRLWVKSSRIETGVDDDGRTRGNQLAGLLMKAAGQTRQKSSTPTPDHGERAVYGTLPKPVDETWVKAGRAGRCPNHQRHMRRRDKGDDQLMDRGAVPCLGGLQLMNEAKIEVCIPRPVSTAVQWLVQHQQQAAGLAADECDAGRATDIAEKEVVEEKVAEVVEWILSGIAVNDTSSAEMRRDGSAQAEELVRART